jgi:hypothetical protein
VADPAAWDRAAEAARVEEWAAGVVVAAVEQVDQEAVAEQGQAGQDSEAEGREVLAEAAQALAAAAVLVGRVEEQLRDWVRSAAARVLRENGLQRLRCSGAARLPVVQATAWKAAARADFPFLRKMFGRCLRSLRS